MTDQSEMTPITSAATIEPTCTCGHSLRKHQTRGIPEACKRSRCRCRRYQSLPIGWEPVEQYPPTFPECGACYGLMTVLSGEGVAPYGYCPACESYTTWALVSRNREEVTDGT